jgi:acyl-coenzyme A synthetase/AMP-(fatty) acid ligase
MVTHPLILASDAPLAWRQGEPILRRQYLADVADLAEQLPRSGHMLNLSGDRYRFAVGLGAALLRGHDNLLPPNHTPDMLARLAALFPGTYVIDGRADVAGAHPVRWRVAARGDATGRIADMADDAIAAHVLTSGSTGDPLPHVKRWGLLWRSTRSGAARLAQHLERADLVGVSLVATVPAQHMYGFESSILVALLAGAAFDTSRPFFPADISAALARVPRPRMLVTTPLHLKSWLDSGTDLPALDLMVCATAPLAPQLAARAEAALNAPLMEIYGCTEAGQVATRRTTRGATWQTYDGVNVAGSGEQPVVDGGHVPEPTVLADVLEIVDRSSFRLLGRANDLINVAGKRSSLAHLNFHLNSIDGVRDGVFWMPPQADAPAGDVVRLVAFVVAPGVTREHLIDALRQRVDAAFLPRRIVWLETLPRDPTGKLPTARVAALAARHAPDSPA